MLINFNYIYRYKGLFRIERKADNLTNEKVME